jgi:hypothetical protein
VRSERTQEKAAGGVLPERVAGSDVETSAVQEASAAELERDIDRVEEGPPRPLGSELAPVEIAALSESDLPTEQAVLAQHAERIGRTKPAVLGAILSADFVSSRIARLAKRIAKDPKFQLSVIWRVVAGLDTVGLSYLLLGKKVSMAASILGLENVTKIPEQVYFERLFEKAWPEREGSSKLEKLARAGTNAVAWRVVGTLDTLAIAFVVQAVLPWLVGHPVHWQHAFFSALTLAKWEVVTKIASKTGLNLIWWKLHPTKGAPLDGSKTSEESSRAEAQADR